MPETAPITEGRWTDLLDLIETGKVVPIIGRRLSIVESGDGQPVPLQHVLPGAMARQLGLDQVPQDWGLSKLYMSAAEKNSYSVDAFHPKLKRVLGSLTPHLDPLRKLAGIKPFRLFLSTAIDGFLEQAVREVRGAQGQTVTSYTFAPGHENPHRAIATSASEVCVYNLLGSRQTCPDWAVTTEDLVEFVIGMQGEKYRPDRLFDALKDRHLLAIGCQIPDWMGRFFLRSLRDGPLSRTRTSTILIDDAQDTDHAFGEYLALLSVSSFVVPGDAVAFVNELHRRWQARIGTAGAGAAAAGDDIDAALAYDAGHDRPGPRPAADDTQPQPAAGTVFLSYSHDDRDSAQQLYEYLRAHRVDVWKDDRDDAIPKGANWDHVIRRRIADCACFVPLISRHSAAKRESYFWAEWNQALRRSQQMDNLSSRFIFPVLCEPDVDLPAQFEDMQWSVLSDASDCEALAAGLRREQQAVRKALR